MVFVFLRLVGLHLMLLSPFAPISLQMTWLYSSLSLKIITLSTYTLISYSFLHYWRLWSYHLAFSNSALVTMDVQVPLWCVDLESSRQILTWWMYEFFIFLVASLYLPNSSLDCTGFSFRITQNLTSSTSSSTHFCYPIFF